MQLRLYCNQSHLKKYEIIPKYFIYLIAIGKEKAVAVAGPKYL